MNSEMRNIYIISGSILLGSLMISLSLIYSAGGGRPAKEVAQLGTQLEKSGQQDNDNSNSSVMQLRPGDVILGRKDAPVTFIEYGDFQCPFCGRLFSQVKPNLVKDYINQGKVKMIYRNFAFLGPESFAAAEAAECAKEQDGFWAYHDLLFEEEIKDGRENNGNLNREFFIKLAERAGLSKSKFITCLDSKKYSDKIIKDSDQARRDGVNSTPTVFINGRLIRGALPYSQFRAVIDDILNQG